MNQRDSESGDRAPSRKSNEGKSSG
jgi:hypothetical protein